MIWLMAATLLLTAGESQPERPSSRAASHKVHLESGDYQWVSLNVGRLPVEVDCRYEVVQGDATVHVELLQMSDFRAFDRGREYEAMAATPDGRTGEFRRLVDQRREYRVVLKNAAHARPVTVLLELRTEPVVARTLPPKRRLIVIGVSFAFFFITVAWSGRMLFRAARR